MENLNKLSYTQYRVNEKLIYVPMEEIVQQYDSKEFAKRPYLFKILYIGKYNKKTNEYTAVDSAPFTVPYSYEPMTAENAKTYVAANAGAGVWTVVK